MVAMSARSGPGSCTTGSSCSSGHDDSDDEDSWEEDPECGTIRNVKQRIGERTSRVHPDYTRPPESEETVEALRALG